MSYEPLLPKHIQKLKDIANTLRINAVQITENLCHGYITSCSSIAELMAVLFYQTLRLNLREPLDLHSDRFVLSKGHAAPMLYAAWSAVGWFPMDMVLNFSQIESDFEGTPTPRLDFIDVNTGSMGCGVSFAAGMAYMGKYFDKAEYRVYVLVGDGESAEGLVWEALQFAGHYQLQNFCVIFDVNRLSANGPTMLQHEDVKYFNRLIAFNFNVVTINGHDIEECYNAFQAAARTKTQPTAILAKTVAGKHISQAENAEQWHGSLLGTKVESVLRTLRNLVFNNSNDLTPLTSSKNAPKVSIKNIKLCGPPDYKLCELVSTSVAYGTALVKIAYDNDRVIVFNTDSKYASHTDMMQEAYPNRFVECFANEQNMIGVAVGAACRDRCCAFAATYAAYLSRAFDQLRIAAISRSNINVVGIDCGISLGPDGPGRMGLEDLAMFRTLPGSVIFYPSDAVSCEYAVELAANTKGICYIRTTRPTMPVIYKNDEKFSIGKGKIVFSTPSDDVLLIGAGITLQECICAAKLLEADCVPARVLDVFTVKPLDKHLILLHGRQCKYRVVVVEDHYRAGGLGEAVISELSEYRKFFIKHLYVSGLPRSGLAPELMQMYGISRHRIFDAAKSILKK